MITKKNTPEHIKHALAITDLPTPQQKCCSAVFEKVVAKVKEGETGMFVAKRWEWKVGTKKKERYVGVRVAEKKRRGTRPGRMVHALAHRFSEGPQQSHSFARAIP